MKRILNRSFVLACAFCVLQVSAQSPSGPKVELSLIVTDKANKPVNTINKADIRVIEDKVEQTVLSVEADERPVDCALVIDTSGSFRSLIASSLEMTRLLIVNRRPDDEMFIERFVSSDLIQTIHDFTRDGNALIESLKNIRIEAGQSAVIDALHVAAEHLAKHNKSSEGGRRKALVIITDGEDRNSYYKQEQLTKLLREEGIQVFILGLVVDLNREGGLIRASPREKAEKLLQTVAEETGGRVFYPKDKAELVEATVQIINHLRGQFRITYQSTNSTGDGFRKVEVNLISPSGEKRKAIVPRGYVPAKAKEQKLP
jgi:Ca-activated chloride channel homolog